MKCMDIIPNKMQDSKVKKTVAIFLMPQHGHSAALLKMAEFLTENTGNFNLVMYASMILKPSIQKNYKKMKVVYMEDGIDSKTFANPGKSQRRNPFTVTLPAVWEPYFKNLKPEFDVILTDMFNITVNKYAIRHGIKLIVNHPSNLTLQVQNNNLLCLQNSIGIGGFTITHPPFYPSYLFRKRGMSENFDAYYKNSFMLIDSCFGFDEPRPLPPNIRMVGMIESGEKKPLKDEKLKEWIQKKKSENKNQFIYAAFGSVVNISTNLAHRIYEGLSKTGYPVIWAFKSSEPFEVNDDNVYISSWLPQTEILSLDQIKVFVTHGGWNSISEGICYGKPLGLIPFFADQPTNARIVQKNGSGLILYAAPNPTRVRQFNLPGLRSENVTKGLQKLFSNYESYKSRVDRIKTLNQGLSGFHVVKDTIEEVIQFGYDHLIDPHSIRLWERNTHKTIRLMVTLSFILILLLGVWVMMMFV